MSLKEKLTSFENIHKLNLFSMKTDPIQKYLDWDSSSVSEAGQDQLKAACYDLSRYAMHLSNLQAEFYSTFTALQRILDKEVGAKAYELYAKNKYLSYDERKAIALQDLDLSNLYNQMVENELYYNRINKMVYSVNELIKKLEGYLKNGTSR